MAGGFPPQLIDEIRSRVDVVDLIGQFVNLRRAGENWKALCPFHAEKTPSFMVNPRKGIFHCFGCGAGGDAFGFLMRQDRLSFPEAVRALGKMTGVALPEERRSETEGQRETLYRALAVAAQFYADALWNRPEGARARQYVATRGIDSEVARRFGLGYAPEGWDHLLVFMRDSGVSEELLAQVGLAVPRQTGGGFYDRFRGRLIFPIRDTQGRPVAFGGRTLGSDEPKYLNSPETPLFFKGQTLYALDLARGALREKNRALLVEGYLDCLIAHQYGFTETVAALGTAFTAAQLALLRRYCDEVITFFDADLAGRKATERVEELLSPSERALAWAVNRTGSFAEGAPRLKVALLPAGHDPDSFLRAEGRARFDQQITEARSLLSYAIDRVLEEENTASQRGRATAFARIALILSKAGDSQEGTTLAREAALKLGVDPTQLWIEVQRLHGALKSRPGAGEAVARAGRERAPSSDQGQPGAAVWPPPAAPERDLLVLLLQVPAARAELLQVLEVDDLSHPGLQALLRGLKERPEATVPEVHGALEQELLAALLVEERSWPDPARLVREYRTRYEIRHRLRRIRQVTQAIARAQATGDPAVTELEAELRELVRRAQEVRELAGTGPAPGADR
ncbi:MAG: DNA primase [Candidatus Rokubacteria bacterium]|nr:DNA primase [Candidatus Rokubacteria bacterium]